MRCRSASSILPSARGFPDVYKRQDVVGVPVTATLQDIVALQAENRFSRIPVYKEDLDDRCV